MQNSYTRALPRTLVLNTIKPNRLGLQTVDSLRSIVRGPVLVPDSPEYDETRKLYNAMIDKKPAVIARCNDVADVISAIKFGHENSLTVAVRGAGHNGGG